MMRLNKTPYLNLILPLKQAGTYLSPQKYYNLLTSVSRKRLKALFFLMLLRRTYTATLSARMTMMKRPPMMPAAISGVLQRHTSGGDM